AGRGPAGRNRGPCSVVDRWDGARALARDLEGRRNCGSSQRPAAARRRARGQSMSDEIVLTLPRERRFYDVAHLVVSGLAARLNLTVDNLADLQLALAGLLPRRESDGEVTVVLRVEGGLLDGRI